MKPNANRDRRADWLPKKTDAELLRDSFAGFFVPALNYLLGVEKGGTGRKGMGKKAKRRSAFDDLQAAAKVGFGAFELGSEKEADHARATILHHRLVEEEVNPGLVRLSRLLQETLASVDAVVEHLGGLVDQVRAPLPYHLALGYYTKLRARLRLASTYVEEGKALFSSEIPPFPEEEFPSLAKVLRRLIELRDTAYLGRSEREHAAERLRKPVERTKRGDVADCDRLAVQDKVAVRASGDCSNVNDYLTAHHADTGINYQGRFYRVSCEGLPVDPYFAMFFKPFLDYLADAKPPFKLSVCAVCQSVYLTTWINTKGKYCDKYCKDEARKARLQRTEP